MRIVIQESGLSFGEYDKTDCFNIEKSTVYKSLGSNVRVIEFILRHKNDEILMIEAKSSSPKPGNNNNFDKFIEEIGDKFAHSIDLFFSLIIGRLGDQETDMPEYFRTADYSVAKITMLLVINWHEISRLSPISEALRRKLKRQMKTWRLNLSVMNHELAGKYGLLK